jgi:5-methylcytosine-specific restriction enzyme A
MFMRGQIYRRSELHNKYGGQRQGGISTPARHRIILLFASEQGEQHGYKDGWTEDGTYLYTGEGQIGDMEFKRGNRAIRDHVQDRKDLHVFEYTGAGGYRYVGPMVCAGYEWRELLDTQGNLRRGIVFELVVGQVCEVPEGGSARFVFMRGTT